MADVARQTLMDRIVGSLSPERALGRMKARHEEPCVGPMPLGRVRTNCRQS